MINQAPHWLHKAPKIPRGKKKKQKKKTGSWDSDFHSFSTPSGLTPR